MCHLQKAEREDRTSANGSPAGRTAPSGTTLYLCWCLRLWTMGHRLQFKAMDRDVLMYVFKGSSYRGD